MILPGNVNDWPEFWKFLYQEHVFVLQYDGMPEEQARAHAEAEQRGLAEPEPPWYENEAEAKKRYEAIFRATRRGREHARFKALGMK